MVLQLTAGEAPAGSVSRSPLVVLCLCLGFSALLHAEPLAAAAELHLPRGVVVCLVASVAALFNWAVLSLNFRVIRRPAAGGARLLVQPTGTTRSASRSPLAPFMGLYFSMSAALHADPLVDAAAQYQIHPAVVVCVILSATALFNWAILSLNFRIARRQAAGGARLLLHPTGTVGAAPTGSGLISPLAPFMVLCLAMSAALHAEPLVDAAAEYQVHPAVLVCVILSATALFNWAILSLNFRVTRRSAAAGARQLLHPTGTAGAAPTGSALISPLAPFMVLCLAMSAARGTACGRRRRVSNPPGRRRLRRTRRRRALPLGDLFHPQVPGKPSS